jgi:Fe-S-cluster-containing hydrogenase component 2
VDKSEFIHISCKDCISATCKIQCKENALLFVAGNLILTTNKCASCAQYEDRKIPACIYNCPKSETKTIVTGKSNDIKRQEIVEVYPSFRL